jgi:transposase
MYAVRWRKAQRRPATFLPLEFEPGQDAQVDWGEAYVILQGQQQKVQVFVMHQSYSRRTFDSVGELAEASLGNLFRGKSSETRGSCFLRFYSC